MKETFDLAKNFQLLCYIYYLIVVIISSCYMQRLLIYAKRKLTDTQNKLNLENNIQNNIFANK
jgi:hypothetical protein